MEHSLAIRIVVLAAGLGLAAEVLLHGPAAGLNIGLATVLVLAAAIAARGGRPRLDRLDAWLPPGAVIFGFAAAIRADPPLLLANIAAAVVLGVASLVAFSGIAVTRRSAAWLGLSTVVVAAESIDGARRPLATLRPRGVRRMTVTAGPWLRGVALAVPLAAIFAVLFSSADPIFAARLGDLVGLRLDLGDLPGRVVFTLASAWLAAGWLRIAAGDAPELTAFATAPEPMTAAAEPNPSAAEPNPSAAEPNPSAGAPEPPGAGTEPVPEPRASAPESPPPGGRPPLPPPPRLASGWAAGSAASATALTGQAPGSTDRPTLRARLGDTEATVALAMLDLLFAAFVVLQVAYLFGGASTLPVVGLTYAEYARRGFFELVSVAALVGAVILAVDHVVARRTRAYVASAVALLALTGVVLASAAVRLRLYQDAYGWTELRFYVATAIAVLAGGTIVAAVLVLRNRVRWLVHGFGLLSLAGLLACTIIGPSAFVADRNLERALDLALVPADGRTGLDADYLASLPDDAVPAIVVALPRLDPVVAGPLHDALERRRAALSLPAVEAWPAWNLARERARAALASCAGC